MFYKLFYLIFEGIKGLFRKKISVLVSSFMIAISLIFLNVIYISYDNFINVSSNIKSKFIIDVFFNDNINFVQASEIYTKILLINGIKSGELIGKDKAAKIFKSFFNEDVNKIIGSNPLPISAKLEVENQFKSANKMSIICQEIRKFGEVDVATYEHNIIRKIDNLFENILGIGLSFTIFVFLVSVMLVTNTIRLIILSRKNFINILELLGATKSFIKFPFVIEGIIQGVLGAILANIILFSMLSFWDYMIAPFIDMDLLINEYVFVINICSGMVLGFTGSYRAISKYT